MGSPLKSSALTVHLAGSRTLKLEQISRVYVLSWERDCVALDNVNALGLGVMRGPQFGAHINLDNWMQDVEELRCATVVML